MAIADGDPRILVPDFLSTFNWFERNQAMRFYALRHGSTGKNYPADEAPASVARRAMVVGVYSANSTLAILPCVALLLFNTFLASDSMYVGTGVLIGAEAVLIAFGLAAGNLRHRKINRYFDEQFPGSLDFRHGTSRG